MRVRGKGPQRSTAARVPRALSSLLALLSSSCHGLPAEVHREK